MAPGMVQEVEFPFLLEGLSLRVGCLACVANFGDKFPYLFVGTFIKALRRAHPCLRGKHLNLPYSFVGTFPDIPRSVPGPTTVQERSFSFFAAQEAARPKPQPHPPPTSCYPPPPRIPAEKLDTPGLRHKLADKPKHPTAVLPSKPSSQS